MSDIDLVEKKINECVKQLRDAISAEIIQKQNAVESYQNQLTNLKDEIIAAQKKIKELDVKMAQETEARIKAIEDKEAEVLKKQEEFDNHYREYEAWVKDLEARKKQVEDYSVLKNEEISNRERDIELKYADLAQIQAKIDENTQKLAEIKTENESKLLDLKKRELQIEGQERKLRDSEAILNDLKKFLEEKEKGMDEVFADISNKIDEANKISQANKATLEEINALKAQNDEQSAILSARKAEIAALVNEQKEQLRQIEAERDKNATQKAELKAKEILLNEKERALKTREDNVKIIENKLKGE